MRKTLVASLIVATIIPSVANAQTNRFEGFSAGLDLNLMSGAVKNSVPELSVDGYGGKQAQSVSLNMAYGFGFGSTGILAVGLDADLSKPTLYSFFEDGGVSGNLKLKNRHSIYIAPGFNVTKDALLYAKLGYTKTKTVGDYVGLLEDSNLSLSGVTYGVGSKLMVSNKTFIKIEAGRQVYSSKSVGRVSVKLSNTVGTVGIGVTF